MVGNGTHCTDVKKLFCVCDKVIGNAWLPRVSEVKATQGSKWGKKVPVCPFSSPFLSHPIPSPLLPSPYLPFPPLRSRTP